jgi:xanthine phosphoribosyltransferase
MAYEDELIISWVELHRDARYLSQLLHQRGAWKGVIAVTRGGMVPAALVARELDIRMVDTVCIASYAPDAIGGAATQQGELRVLKDSIAGDGDGWLLIDDLVDTGRTAQMLRKILPKAFFATLYEARWAFPRGPLCERVQAKQVDPFSVGHHLPVCNAHQGRRPRNLRTGVA